ncbi:hypothetical protein Tco_0416790, partial [Tanacetum coccineum]
MGGSKATDHYERNTCEKIRMGIHLCKGLKVTQSFTPITEHMEIMKHIKKQLARSQQGWVDDLAQ